MKILSALIVKEFHQMTRDPSSIIIAFVMPLMLLFIYMFGVNLDTVRIDLGIKNDDNSPETQILVKSFDGSKYIRAKEYDRAETMYQDMAKSKLKGFVVIPNDFTRQLENLNVATLQVVTDGSEVNLANYAQSYPRAILNNWL